MASIRVVQFAMSFGAVVLMVLGCAPCRDREIYLGLPAHRCEKALREVGSTITEVRVHAVADLGQCVPDDRTVAALLKAMNDPETEVRQWAALSMGKLAGDTQLQKIKLRRDGASAFENIVNTLVGALSDEEVFVRDQAASSLYDYGLYYGKEVKGAAAPLIDRLKHDDDQSVRESAYLALEVIDPALLESDEPELREAISEVLEQWGRSPVSH